MATNQIRIALIGLTILERLGLREIAGLFPKVETIDFINMAELLGKENQADAYVVDSEAYLLNPTFFLPRRLQTLVVMRHSRRDRTKSEIKPDESLPVTIYFDSDESEIEDSLLSIIKEAKKIELPSDTQLSAREREVLRELAGGKTNKEIADTLCISINTVITHRKNISGKLGIHGVSGLSLYAVMNGVI